MNEVIYMKKKGYISIELIALTSIIVIAGLVGYAMFIDDAKDVFNVSKKTYTSSIEAFDVDTKTKISKDGQLE